MKKILISLIIIALILGFSTMAYGNSGKALIPPGNFSYLDSNNFKPCIYITNITNKIISVTMKFYDKTGTIIKNSFYTNFYTNNISNLNSDPSNASILFDLAPNATCSVMLLLSSFSPDNFGYGIIEWIQDSTAIYGLIAYGSIWLLGNGHLNSFSTLEINNGLPF